MSLNDTEHRDTDTTLVTGGLLVALFGLIATVLAIGAGWVPALLLGVVFFALAWKFPLNSSARMLRAVSVLFGAAALIGALVDLLT
jgi:hypothetical protein